MENFKSEVNSLLSSFENFKRAPLKNKDGTVSSIGEVWENSHFIMAAIWRYQSGGPFGSGGGSGGVKGWATSPIDGEAMEKIFI